MDVEVPDLGLEGGDQATVVEWRCEEGDTVEEGEFICELESENGTVEVTAPITGVVVERIVEEDEIVRVGETLALIEARDPAEFEEEE
jgi:pyruvate/2-oxoglutarate dehydrogenase complex dihydrolipoamide acyltransferase (E2) component